MKTKKLTDFDYHELLDRTSMIMMNIDTHLVNHQASKKNKEIVPLNAECLNFSLSGTSRYIWNVPNKFLI